jgi:hypothetical protein
VKIALKVVVQNDGDFMGEIVLYVLEDRRCKLVCRLFNDALCAEDISCHGVRGKLCEA